MIICGSHVFQFSVSKDMKKWKKEKKIPTYFLAFQPLASKRIYTSEQDGGAPSFKSQVQ